MREKAVIVVGCVIAAVLTGCSEAPEVQQVTPAKIEQIESEENGRLETEETNTNYIQLGEKKTIEGYQLADGMEVPITATLWVESVARGTEALELLAGKNPDLAQPEEGMEYLVAQIGVSYDKGDSEYLNLAENHASLVSASLYFALSNGDSNGQQVTELTEKPFYELIIAQGESGGGQVAFLVSEKTVEPLVFVGYNNSIMFELK